MGVPMATSPDTTRRTSGARSNARTEQLISAVMGAAIAELASSGYDGFRVEAVATAAGINKTSVYRRWPTKLELVTAALRARSNNVALPDTGTLRGDLKAVTNHLGDRYSGQIYRSLMQIVLGANAAPEFLELMAEVRTETLRHYAQIIERAKARGELPDDVDGPLVIELILAPLANRALRLQEPLSPELIDQVIDLVLLGATRR